MPTIVLTSGEGSKVSGVTMIADIMLPRVETVHLDDDLNEVQTRMRQAGLSAIVALDGAKFKGIITTADIARALDDRGDAGTVRVRDIATNEARHCLSSDDEETALATMNATSSDWLAVFDGKGELAGLVPRDELRADQGQVAPRVAPPAEDDQTLENPGLQVHSEKPTLRGRSQ